MSRDAQVPASSRRKRRLAVEKPRESYAIEPEDSLGDDRRSLSRRLFSEEDEIHLLRAFLEITKDCPSPPTAAATLFKRVGKSLSVEITNTQLIDKLRKLRNKYNKQAVNTDLIKQLSPHEREVFEISCKIWGGEALHRSSNGSTEAPESAKKRRKKKKEPEALNPEPENAAVQCNGDVDVELDLEKNYSCLMEELSRLSRNETMKEGLKRLDPSELERLNKSWRLQQISEAKCMGKRAGLVQELKDLILEAIVAHAGN